MKRMAKFFVRHGQATPVRIEELTNHPSTISDEEVDSVIDFALSKWWSSFDKPLQDEKDDRFLYNFYCLVHVRPEDEPDSAPTTFMSCFHRITSPSIMEFVEAITYKTHQRKIPVEFVAKLSSDKKAREYVKKIKNAMTAKHDVPVVPMVEMVEMN